MTLREWHYLKDGREWGPVTRDELDELVAEGHVPPSVLVRRVDQTDWLPLDDAVDMTDQSPPMPVLPAGVLTYEIPRKLPERLYASFGARTGGFLVDYFVFAFSLVALLSLLEAGIGVVITERTQQAVFALAAFLYFSVLESSRWQGTLGKRVTGVIVTDVHGQPISFARSAGRTAAKVLSFGTLYVGFLLALFTPRKQSLHDLIAGTLVLRK